MTLAVMQMSAARRKYSQSCSYSLESRRLWPSQLNVRSATQRRGRMPRNSFLAGGKPHPLEMPRGRIIGIGHKGPFATRSRRMPHDLDSSSPDAPRSRSCRPRIALIRPDQLDARELCPGPDPGPSETAARSWRSAAWTTARRTRPFTSTKQMPLASRDASLLRHTHGCRRCLSP